MDAEDLIANQIRAHTESWQGKKDTQEDRYFQHVRMGKLGTAVRQPACGVWCLGGYGCISRSPKLRLHPTPTVTKPIPNPQPSPNSNPNPDP